MCECEFIVISDESTIDIDNAPIDEVLTALETQLSLLNSGDGEFSKIVLYFEGADYTGGCAAVIAEMTSDICI